MAEHDQPGLDQCLALMDGFSKSENLSLALMRLNALREQHPVNRAILEKIVEIFRKQGREAEGEEIILALAAIELESGENEKALAHLQEVEGEGKNRLAALELKARILCAMTRNDESVAVYLELIFICEESGLTDEAMRFYKSALELLPANLEIHARLLRLLAETGRMAEMVERGEQLLPLLEKGASEEEGKEILKILTGGAPDHVPFLLAHANFLARLDQAEPSREAWQKAISILSAHGEFEKGVHALQRILRTNPHDLAATEALADCRMKLGARPQALLSYQSLAEIYRERGFHAEQLNVLRKIVDANPSDVRTLQQLLVLYEEKLNLPAEAREIRRNMARIYFERGTYPKALELCEPLLATDRRDMTTLELRLQIYGAMRNVEKLRGGAQEVLDAYRTAGDFSGARRVLDLLITHFPDDKDVLALLVGALCDEGEADEALPLLQRALDLNYQAGRMEDCFNLLRQIVERAEEPACFFNAWNCLCVLPGVLRGNWEQVELFWDLLVRLGHEELVLRSLREIVVAHPDFEPVWIRYINQLESAGLKSEAVDALRRWARLASSNGNREKANENYSRAISFMPDDLDLLNETLEFRAASGIRQGAADLALSLASLTEAQGLIVQSIHVIVTALELGPENDDLQQRLAELMELFQDDVVLKERYLEISKRQTERREFLNARTTLTEAVRRFPLDVSIRRQLIGLLQEMGLDEEAVSEMSSLSFILADCGDSEGAIRLADEVMALDPGNLKAQSLRAEIHARLGEKDLALQEFRSLSAQFESEAPKRQEGKDTRLEPASPLTIEMLPVKAEYSFSEFVVGSHNNFAYSTAVAIARNPGNDFNPLFLYGDVGLGKTHLLHAIVNRLRETLPDIRLVYTSSEEFTNGLIEAIQSGTIREFRNFHKNADVLLIDDIQFLGGQERAQEEFFHIFNALFQANRQIVMTSDRPPREIAHLEKRLRSRFGGGVIVEIQSPDLETRVAILRRDAQNAGIVVDGAALNVIAQRICSNIRDLKAAIKQIEARIRIANEPPTPESLQRIVDLIAGRSEEKISA